MEDFDLEILEQAKETVFLIDKKYRRASFPEKLELREARDQAFNAYALARINLLREGILATSEDVQEMKKIHQEIDNAALIQGLIGGIIRWVGFLTKFFA